MAFFVDDLYGIQGVGVVRDPRNGHTSFESCGPSGMMTVEDQNDYYYSWWNPNDGTVLHRSGDSISGTMRVQSVCAELMFDDGFFYNYSLTNPNDRVLNSFYQKHSIIGNFNEIANKVAISASPGFTWGRSGNVPPGTWLLNDSVPSNKSGRMVFLNSASLMKVFVTNEKNTTYSIDVYEHDKTTYTLLTTVTVTANYSGTFTITGVNLTTGKELAMKVSSGSANTPKEVVAGVLIKGDA
jgi:hypothetical protein